MGVIKYTILLTMVALFSIALFSFASHFAIDNDAAVTVTDEGFDDYTDSLKGDIDDFYIATNISGNEYQKSTISTQTESTEGGTQFKVTSSSSLLMAKKSLELAWEKIFGQDSEFKVILTAVLSLFGFILFMLLWKAWAGRNPE